MRRSRALASGFAILAVIAVGCGDGTPDAEQVYLDTIRAVVPEAADVSDDTLIRVGVELCRPGDEDETIQRAIEVLYGELDRFEVPEFDIVSSALGAAPAAFCPADSDNGSTAPGPSEPAPSAPGRAELDAALANFQDLLRSAIEGIVPGITVDGAPAQVELTDLTMNRGVLAIEVSMPADGADIDQVAFELTRALAPIESLVTQNGPLMAALLRGGPSLEMHVVVDAGEVEAMTLDAGLIADLASGVANFEDWRERVTREAP